MRFPPIKPDRALLWITLAPDASAAERSAALRTVLKQCRLHPLDTTPSAELVIVEEAAFRAHQDAICATLGPADRLHLIARAGDRLAVEVFTAPPEPPVRPAEG